MRRTFLLSGIAALLLAGFAWAEDEPKHAPIVVGWLSEDPADVLVLQAESEQSAAEPSAPNQSAVDAKEEWESRHSAELYKIQQSQNKALLGGPMTVQVQNVMAGKAPGEYWLGLECYLVVPVLRVHLNLPENQGLVVNRVIPESPAAKAGVEANDILLQAGEKKLAAVKDLLDAVEAAKETPLKLEMIHAGKPKTIELAPVKRPNDVLYWNAQPPADLNKLKNWVGEMQGGQISGAPGGFSFRLIQPGAILPQGAPALPEMPDNLSINIDRNDDKPAKITVTWNDKKWEITEKELDKLPPEVRPHVERMLGHTKGGNFGATGGMIIGGGGTHGGNVTIGSGGGMTMSGTGVMTFTPNLATPGVPMMQPAVPHAKEQVRPRRSVEERLDELNRKIDELRKELREKRDEPQPPVRAENDEEKDEPELPRLPEK